MPDITQILTFIFGGGLAALIAASIKAVGDYRQGRVMRDDTAITRWRELADEREEQARNMQHELDWYRSKYAEIRATWLAMPPADKPGDFPAVPPPPPRGDTPTN